MTSRIRFPRSASVRLSAHMRRASSMIKDKMMRPQSERNLNSQTSSSIDTQLPRQKNVSPSLSSRKLDEPLDDEQKHSQVLSKLPASGFNRLKNLWAIRENAVGFTSPLSTWSRPYASFNQSKKDTSPKIHYDERTKTYTAKFDLDRTNESFINFGQPIEKCSVRNHSLLHSQPNNNAQTSTEKCETVTFKTKNKVKFSQKFIRFF